MAASRPNILYLHSHDTGRYIQPFGYAMATPNLQRLAEGGVLFRQNHCACPTCSPSRSALLTGTYPHQNGMMGLAHRGFSLNDYSEHIVHQLKAAGYRTALSGVQHIAGSAARRKHADRQLWQIIGYDEYLGEAPEAHVQAVRWLRERRFEPFFLAVGFAETHRVFPDLEGDDPEDSRYVLPPSPLPDTPETRRDLAAFAKMARLLDEKMGEVIEAIDDLGLGENTLIICTTDHGIAFPRMKCSLHDSGTGTFLILRGAGGFSGGRVFDAMTSHLDLYPTICDVVGLEKPPRLEGRSLLPLLRGEVEELHEALYAEVTYHASYEPMRAVRTKRYKYIRRFDGRLRPVLPNVDGGPSKDLWVKAGWGEMRPAEEMLFDLVFDPNESSNLIGDPRHGAVAEEMRTRLRAWMRETGDPVLAGFVLPPQGAEITWMDAAEPESPARFMMP